MQILLIGDAARREELHHSRNFGEHTLTDADTFAAGHDLVIDLSLDEHPERLDIYKANTGVPVLACMVKATFDVPHIFGCNWLPGFMGMKKLEIALPASADRTRLDAIMQQLEWPYEVVQAAPGLVTPRVVCMIINEAYFTAEEGTATREDIDTSMKLGTNYPFGPFEWSRKIGVRNVYDVLQAVHAHTGNERYKVCALLEQEALQ